MKYKYIYALPLLIIVAACEGQTNSDQKTNFTKQEFINSLLERDDGAEEKTLIEQENKAFAFCLNIPTSALKENKEKAKKLITTCSYDLPDKFDLTDNSIQPSLEKFEICLSNGSAKSLGVSFDEYEHCLDQINPDIPIDERLDLSTSEEERNALLELEKIL